MSWKYPGFPGVFHSIQFISALHGFSLPILRFDCSGRPIDLLPFPSSPPPPIPAVFHKEERSGEEERRRRSRRGCLPLTHLYLSFRWPAQVLNMNAKLVSSNHQPCVENISCDIIDVVKQQDLDTLDKPPPKQANQQLLLLRQFR